MSSIPRPFGAQNGMAGETSTPQSLATPDFKDGQSRRSTISIFSTPHSAETKPDINTPLLSPTPSQTSFVGPASPRQSSEFASRDAKNERSRTASFLSHAQHYEILKSGSRGRSDSDASTSSAQANSSLAINAPKSAGTASPFGLVTNLVSSVRHACAPGVANDEPAVKDDSTRSDGPPIQRFLECEADDLKMSEIAILLADYKRLAARLSSPP